MKTLDYTPELFQDICDNYLDYFQTGYTVCGAQDPAFIILGEGFSKTHPELDKYMFVRVTEEYLNAWNSATLLQFSNEDMTEAEYADYNKVMEEEDVYV